MKARDVILVLKQYLPLLTDRFSDRVVINSLSRSGSTITALTSGAHDLLVGDTINVSGAIAPIPIVSITVDPVTYIATITTAEDHDVTYNEIVDEIIPQITISGANEPEWNDTFDVTLPPPNRRTIELQVNNTFTSPATGTMLLDDKATFGRGYNGLQVVTATPTATSFEYQTDKTPYSPAIGTPILHTANRITGVVSFDRAQRAYTQLTQDGTRDNDKFWCFVLLGDTVSNKDRNDETDAFATRNQGDDYRQRILSTFQVFIFCPTTDDFAGGRDARDEMQDIRAYLFKSLLNVKFDDGLCENPFSVTTYVSDSLFLDQDAYIVHQFTFQSASDIIFDDVNQDLVDCAFRDIFIDFLPDKPDLAFEADINLDDDPLPT